MCARRSYSRSVLQRCYSVKAYHGCSQPRGTFLAAQELSVTSQSNLHIIVITDAHPNFVRLVQVLLHAAGDGLVNKSDYSPLHHSHLLLALPPPPPPRHTLTCVHKEEATPEQNLAWGARGSSL